MPRLTCLHKKYNDKVAMTGNVISDIQFSKYIRTYNNIECNGFEKEKGELFQYDINSLPSYVPCSVKSKLRKLSLTQERSFILYCIRHYNNKKVMIIGYIITDNSGKHIETIGGNTYKQDEVITEFKKAIGA